MNLGRGIRIVGIHLLTTYPGLLQYYWGWRLLVNSDAHDVPDLLTPAFATAVLKGSGLNEAEVQQVFSANPQALLNTLSLPSHQ